MKAYWFFGDLVKVHLTGEETEGRFSLTEWLQPPGEWTPLHVHKDADQTMYVLEGEFTLYLPGKKIVTRPGEVVHGPKGVPHTENITSSQPVRLIEIVAPAGFEDFVAEVGRPADEPTLPDPPLALPDDIEEIAARHEIEILGPPGELP